MVKLIGTVRQSRNCEKGRVWRYPFWNNSYNNESCLVSKSAEGKHDDTQNHSCGILSMPIFNFSIFQRQIYVIKSIKFKDGV